MFVSDVNLSMMKPRYKLNDTSMLLSDATGYSTAESYSLDDELALISSDGRL